MKVLKIHVSNLIAMEKKIHVAVTIVVMAFGLILATVGSAQSGHAQQNATSSASSAAKSAGGAMNKTASSAGAAASNKTGGGNASSSSSSNPLAKVPVIGKLFGGK
ncbi:MAG: hypothetical protein JO327_03255 [Nitrososphaeraceae archaeon]|nr:hypothetical protein [Nitrososphaeraceae archaeon]